MPTVLRLAGEQLLRWFHLSQLLQLHAVSLTWLAADCWRGASLLIFTVLIPWEADPASFHSYPDSVSETKAEAVRPLEAYALAITQPHLHIFCWLKQKDKTSLESRGGRKEPPLACIVLLSQFPTENSAWASSGSRPFLTRVE